MQVKNSHVVMALVAGGLVGYYMGKRK